MTKIITGIKSTGSSLHLGNLMGAVLPFAEAAKRNDAAIFVADLHTINSIKNGKTLREQTREIVIEYFSIFGIDTPITIFVESDIVNLPKMSLILSNVTPYSLMLRAHAFKDAEAKGADVNMGTFNYPILMAADVLGYDGEAVPVGRDQLQHLEMMRDIARNFNKVYEQDIFIEPEPIIVESLATLPGIDGRKMSKSYDNFIGVFDDDKTLRKRIMSIVTDSLGVDEVKDPDTCNVFALYNVFASNEQTAELRVKYQSKGIGFGYGHAKTALLDVLTEYLSPYREARAKLLEHPELVEARLAEGARIMNARLDAKMEVVKRVVGVN